MAQRRQNQALLDRLLPSVADEHHREPQTTVLQEIVVTRTAEMDTQLAETVKNYNEAHNKAATDEDGCGVCYTPYPVSKAAILPCGHTFCAGCIKKLVKNECPNCRRIFQRESVVRNVPNEFFKKAIENQAQVNGVGHSKIDSVMIEGGEDFVPVSDDIDWTKVTKIKICWKKIKINFKFIMQLNFGSLKI